MDEVPMSFVAPYSRTVDSTGAESIPVSTTGHEKTGFTVVLACSESGKKLKLKDGWIEAEWLFGARESLASKTRVFLRQNLATALRQFQRTH